MATSPKVVIVGGGPVGALAALYAARRGCLVELYDLRDDPNIGDLNARPDIAVIPLVLSERGIRAIEGSNTPGLLKGILDESRPIYTRMIHTRDDKGQPRKLPMVYGPQGQCLHTIKRENVTKHCMVALMKEPKATMHFNQRLASCDFDQNIAIFESNVWKPTSQISGGDFVVNVTGNETDPFAGTAEVSANLKHKPVRTSKVTKVPFDFIIGADGTHSSVRQSMMRKSRMNFSQEYVGALWCDFIFPAKKSDGDLPLDSRSLHVWSADQGIVVAQPNLNNTFRAGLVCDTLKFRQLEAHPEEFASWFSNEFPGIVPELLSSEEATRQFMAHQNIPLNSIKPDKLGYKDKAVLFGNSCHDMMPFHAMGMNIGLEDVRVFFEDFVDARISAVELTCNSKKMFCAPGTVQAYEEHRIPDIHAMVDMTSDRYRRLRIRVREPADLAREITETLMSRWVPRMGWTTVHARVHFGHERFTVVRQKEARQAITFNVVPWTAYAILMVWGLPRLYPLWQLAVILYKAMTGTESRTDR